MAGEREELQYDIIRLLRLVANGTVSVEDAADASMNYHTDTAHIELVENETQLKSKAEVRLYRNGWRKKVK